MSRRTLDSRTALDQAISELRDLPYSYWREMAKDGSSFTRPLPEYPGRLEVAADWHTGTQDIRVTITLKRTWRRALKDGFTITPMNEFR
ncbi:MAG: hypothetical protein CL477_19585 [Acidobacteria bacterium]|jgi:hypothetical protein|nr:hypothetical protein [Acidobacteriota bacterium]MDP7692732.1 hypothetical protein [Vicinamibacterales bacterium]HJN45681.1 hypothetical protein [Vicinamibacterales bacterium]|tara:strand:+ start:409 stop:675 length:267 start_codon:yes stop_codon:yes gene_type:complete